MRTLALATLLVASLAPSAPAQLTRKWVRHFNGGGSSEDYGGNAVIDSKGNVVLTGIATSASGESEILVVKYDRNGVLQWSRTLPAIGGGPDFGWDVAVDGQGNVIVGGDSLGMSDYDIVIAAFGSGGNLLWSQRYDGPAGGFDGMQGPGLALDSSGDILVAGTSVGLSGSLDGVVLKYSSTGMLLWEKRYSGAASDGFLELQVDAAGNAVAMGWTVDPVSSFDVLVLKCDPSGSLLWTQVYDGPASAQDFGYSVALDAQENVLVTGYTTGVGTGFDALTLKLDSDGVLQWARNANGAAGRDDIGMTIAASDQGFVAVTGTSQTYYYSPATTWLYDADGNLLWSQSFDVSNLWFGDGSAFGCAFDAAGNLFVSLWGWAGPPAGQDTFLVEYAPTGALLSQDRFDGPTHADDIAFLAGFGPQGDLVLVGHSQRGASRSVDTTLLLYGPKSKLGYVQGPPAEVDPLVLPLVAAPRRSQPAPSTRAMHEPEPMRRLKALRGGGGS
jgi:hypothetical protein